MKKKVVVIGGGPSGIMAAIACKEKNPNFEVTIIEKKSKLGTKLLISGGGRCNVTNSGDNKHIVENVIGNGKFLYSALNQFSSSDIINFFETNGCKLKEEDRGRMFPRSDRSIDILKTLQHKLNTLGVKIWKDCSCKDVIVKDDKVLGVVLGNGEELYANHFVFATGGKSYSAVGTTGDGYKLLKKLNHTITRLYPCEVPLVSNDNIIKNKSLMGLSFPNVELTITNSKNKKFVTIINDIIFTHFGISGPGALRCSSFVDKVLQKEKNATLKINFFANYTKDEITSQMLNLINEHPDKLALNIMSMILNKKVMQLIFTKLSIKEVTKAKELRKHLNEIVTLIFEFKITINGTLGFDKAFVTGGGVKIKEIDPKTMRSKLNDNISICGELIDINAYTGGYNITAALSTGYVCGSNI